jgi:hypothetical protein
VRKDGGWRGFAVNVEDSTAVFWLMDLGPAIRRRRFHGMKDFLKWCIASRSCFAY